MRSISSLLLLFSVAVVSSRLTEQSKENFFQYLTGMPEGRDFLSTVASRIIDRTHHFLQFSYASYKHSMLGSSIGDWFQCETCKASVMALDASMRTQIVTKSLEEFGVLVCH
jgi:hypothetical protein